MESKNFIIIGLCFATLLVMSNCHKRQNLYKTLEHLCQRKSEISSDELEQYRNGDYDNMDQKLKCYIHCLMERMGYIKSNRLVNKHRIIQFEQLDPNYEDIVDQCQEQNNAFNDPCDYGFNLMSCIRKMKQGTSVFQPPNYYNWN